MAETLADRQYRDSFRLEYAKLGLAIIKEINDPALRDSMLTALYDYLNETSIAPESK